MSEAFLSVCIPSYNRPDTLIRLLSSIDCHDPTIEIVICEDKAPQREEIREAVHSFQEESTLKIRYHENETNLGYDGNLRRLTEKADGQWILFMGDDDVFVPDRLTDYLQFLKEHAETGYVLRSYLTKHKDGTTETFRYYDETRFFPPGAETYVELFRKSVFISGFCFQRILAQGLATDRFDGSLLYQLYLQAEICMNHPSAYYDIPLTMSVEDDATVHYFGSSAAEQEIYNIGAPSIESSVNFVSRFFAITEYMDDKYGIDSTRKVKEDMSRYAYPILSIQRKRGRREFKVYANRLRSLGLDCTRYFTLYYRLLYLFGERLCDAGIRTAKRMLGRTPKL